MEWNKSEEIRPLSIPTGNLPKEMRLRSECDMEAGGGHFSTLGRGLGNIKETEKKERNQTHTLLRSVYIYF